MLCFFIVNNNGKDLDCQCGEMSKEVSVKRVLVSEGVVFQIGKF